MKADTVQLVNVFGANRRHVIRVLQRPYVWEQERNWEPLWSNVRVAAEKVEAEMSGTRALAGQPPRSQFLGAIALERLPPAPGPVLAMKMIDRQQGLITLQVSSGADGDSTYAVARSAPERMLEAR